NVEHSLLRVLRADGYHLFAILNGSLLNSLQTYIPLDKLDCAIRAGRDRLNRRPREPVDHGPAGYQAEQERSMEYREIFDMLGESMGERDDNREYHCRRANYRRS